MVGLFLVAEIDFLFLLLLPQHLVPVHTWLSFFVSFFLSIDPCGDGYFHTIFLSLICLNICTHSFIRLLVHSLTHSFHTYMGKPSSSHMTYPRETKRLTDSLSDYEWLSPSVPDSLTLTSVGGGYNFPLQVSGPLSGVKTGPLSQDLDDFSLYSWSMYTFLKPRPWLMLAGPAGL